MNPFPPNWHLPEYPLLSIAFFLSCALFMGATYSVIGGVMLRGKFIAVPQNPIYASLFYKMRVKCDVLLGSLTFAYMMGFIFYN